MHFITNVPAEDFVAMLAHASCLVGNSSAGIKECSFLGTPVVNIGARQQGRLAADARRARRLRLGRDRRARSDRSWPTAATRRRRSTTGPTPARQIVDVLASAELYTQKRFFENATNLKACRPHEHFESSRRHHGPRRVEGHSRQEPEAAGGEAAARLHDRSGARVRRAGSRSSCRPTTRPSPMPAARMWCDVPFLRPADLARDDTPHLPVIQHAVEVDGRARRLPAGCGDDPAADLAAAKRRRHYRCRLRCSTERRRFGVERECRAGPRASDADAARRRRRPRRRCLSPASRCAAASTGGRTCPEAWVMNGAIYACRTPVLFAAEPSLYGDRVVAYRMPAERSISIDDLARLVGSRARARRSPHRSSILHGR